MRVRNSGLPEMKLTLLAVGMAAVMLVTACAAAAQTPRSSESPAGSEVPPAPHADLEPGTPPPAETEIGSLTVGDSRVRPADDMQMVYVPAGSFQMGSTQAQIEAAIQLCTMYPDDYNKCRNAQFTEEAPAGDVSLAGFWIDRTEVTFSQYARCVEAGACRTARLVDLTTDDQGDLPAAGIPWQDATDYCAWAGGSLPSEAQWEYAARGADNLIFPWGNDFECSGGNFWDDYTGCSDGYAEAAPVGSFPGGQSWCGALDMAGNVWEWVADPFMPYPYLGQSASGGAGHGEQMILRGGSWAYMPAFVRTAFRYPVPITADYQAVGFRCVMDDPGE